MSHTLKEAKNNLSGLIRQAEKGEPQIISRNKREVAVVVSIEDWKKLNGQRLSLVEVLRTSPLIGEEIDLSRLEDFPREFDFGE